MQARKGINQTWVTGKNKVLNQTQKEMNHTQMIQKRKKKKDTNTSGDELNSGDVEKRDTNTEGCESNLGTVENTDTEG